MAYPNSTINDWATDDLPDLLWLVCLVSTLGDAAAAAFSEFQQLVIDVVDDPDRVRIDGRLTSLESVPSDLRMPIVEAVRASGLAERLFPAEVIGVARLYDGMPGAWLLRTPWDDDPGLGTDDAMNFEASAVMNVVRDRHLNALVKTPLFGWGILRGKLSLPSEMVDLLSRYPTDEASQGEADAAILSSFLSFKAIELLAAPELEEAWLAWASSFWRQNRLISACLPEYEVRGSEEAESNSNEVQNESGDEAEEEDELAANAARYSAELSDIANRFYAACYDPDLGLDLHRPARSEVLMGLATRAFRTVAAAIHAPHLWTGEHGSYARRVLVETQITMEWLLAHASEGSFERFQTYGVGKRKLLKKHMEQLAETLGDDSPEELVAALAKLEARTGGEWGEEFQEVNLEPTFSGVSLRAMAVEVGERDRYNNGFQSTSGVMHGEWWALEEYSLQRCINPLHRFHQVPDLDVSQPEPHPRFPEILLGELSEIVDLAIAELVGEEPAPD